MDFLIVLLTVAIVLDCAVLILLVLMQLPKKEAGAGVAFGGAATDALFGAGSGNFLTKATKYSAGIFFALAVALSYLQTWQHNRSGNEIIRGIEQQQSRPAPLQEQPNQSPPAAPVTPAPAIPSKPMGSAGTNLLSGSAPATPAPSNSSAPSPK